MQTIINICWRRHSKFQKCSCLGLPPNEASRTHTQAAQAMRSVIGLYTTPPLVPPKLGVSKASFVANPKGTHGSALMSAQWRRLRPRHLQRVRRDSWAVTHGSMGPGPAYAFGQPVWEKRLTSKKHRDQEATEDAKRQASAGDRRRNRDSKKSSNAHQQTTPQSNPESQT